MSSKQATLGETTDEEPWKEEETLRELYHDDDLNQSEIAEELGTTASTISYWMSKFEIETTHSDYGQTIEEVDGLECEYYEVCGNETPGPRNALCDTCLDLARQRTSDGLGSPEEFAEEMDEEFVDMTEHFRRLYDYYDAK